MYRSKGTLTSLSEQQLVDCSWNYGNAGCKGGLMNYAFKYIMSNGGICSASAYPYVGYDNVSTSYIIMCSKLKLLLMQQLVVKCFQVLAVVKGAGVNICISLYKQ